MNLRLKFFNIFLAVVVSLFFVACDDSSSKTSSFKIPGVVHFYNTGVSSSATKEFVCENTGETDVMVQSVTFSDSVGFTFNSSVADETVLPGESLTRTITFSSDTAGFCKTTIEVYYLLDGSLVSKEVPVSGDCGGKEHDFEDLTLSTESYWNGSDEAGSFATGDITLSNTYNTTYSSWDGFAYSNRTDVDSTSFSGQYTAYADSSDTYAVYYPPFSGTHQILVGMVSGDYSQTVSGMYIANNSYAYHSMVNGDGYAKPFGGAKGKDPDWFKVTIYAVSPTTYERDESKYVEFYLADYRFENSAEDYILKDWTWVDLSSLGEVFGLEFELSGSDVSAAGYLNTPAYFAVDKIVLYE